MADFVERISDDRAACRLERAIRGRGVFRRFRDDLFEEYPEGATSESGVNRSVSRVGRSRT